MNGLRDTRAWSGMRGPNTRRWALAAALGVGMLGCAGADDPAPGAPDSAGEAPGELDGGEGAGPDAGPLEPGRRARRISVDQLAGILDSLTGGLRWEENFGGGAVDMFAVFGAGIGAPDYLLVTEESLEPNLMIAKFVEDAALRVCPRWVDAERSRDPAARTLIRHADADSTVSADVEQSLSALERRAFGRPAGAAPSVRVQQLASLFAEVATGPSAARRGWIAVCVAALTDPELALY